MPIVVFGPPFKKAGVWSLLLESPRQTYSTNCLGDIVSLLKMLEAEARAGAWVALMLSYEAAAAFDSHLQTHSAPGFPLLWAAIFDGSIPIPPHKTGTYELGHWEPAISREDYSAAIASIRESISSGNTYQVNYTFPMTASFRGDSLAWYRDLCEAQPANYSVYLELENHTVLSISPELFFETRGDRITTRPMKGTNKRGRWAAEDHEMARLLSSSAKQRAENVMIVDLLRNDLGRISVSGSVEVTDLFSVERYPTLWQMTSTVQSQLKPETALVDVMSALFPCGSITGAPKISTMGIIKDLERFPRRSYTGTIGLIAPGGDCTFNVAIRTVLLNSETGEATFGVGGGITYESTADSEYDECLLKCSFLTTPPAHFALFESILLESGEYFLLDKHLARLEGSAVYFDFSFNQPLVRERLNELREEFATGSWKVRLILTQTGEITVETLAVENEPTSVTRVGLADESVDSNDFSLYHKLTTNVARYQRPLATHPDWDDALLWNERGEITESSVANIVVRRGEKLITPRLECGLLPGTFREALLELGEISEEVVTKDELRSVDEFFLINSVRKWRKSKLIQ
jgi:para-aminobenzoate synthetase/4-amino-4-deoxychorismate lyase